jgi:hypothetical protein
MRECLTDNSEPAATPTHWPNGRSRGVQRVSHRHDAIIDAIIADPRISQHELAARFGYTAGWVSQINQSYAEEHHERGSVRRVTNIAVHAGLNDLLAFFDNDLSRKRCTKCIKAKAAKNCPRH